MDRRRNLTVEIEEVTAVFRLGAVTDTDEAGQRDGGFHRAGIGAVDVQVRRGGFRAGDEGQMRDGAGIVGHAVVVIGHTKERRAVGAGVVPLLVLESRFGVAEVVVRPIRHMLACSSAGLL